MSNIKNLHRNIFIFDASVAHLWLLVLQLKTHALCNTLLYHDQYFGRQYNKTRFIASLVCNGCMYVPVRTTMHVDCKVFYSFCPVLPLVIDKTVPPLSHQCPLIAVLCKGIITITVTVHILLRHKSLTGQNFDK